MTTEVRKIGASDIDFGTSTATSTGGKVYHQFSASDLPLDTATGASTDAAIATLQNDMTNAQVIVKEDYINFPTPGAVPTNVGDTYWENTYKTLATVLTSAVTIQHGQEVLAYVNNKTASPIANGRVVYVSGGTGKRGNVTLADNDAEVSSRIIGVATEDIAANSGVGYVTLVGNVNGIDTTGAESESGLETWNEGDILYLSGTAGKMTNVAPVAPKYTVIVGTITDKSASGTILVAPHFMSGRVPNGGTTGQVLAKASNSDRDVEWVTGGGGASAFTDLTDVPSSYGTGDAGKVVTVNATEDGLEFVAAPTTAGAIYCSIDGAGSAITTGVACDVIVPFDCTITGATLLADQTGSIVIDIWKDTYANAPPTVADTITASAKPTLSSEAKSQDNTLTGWTTSVSAGDVLRFNVDSAATVTKILLTLNVTKG